MGQERKQNLRGEGQEQGLMVSTTDCVAAVELKLAQSDWVRPWGAGGQPRDQLARGHGGKVLWDMGRAVTIRSSPGTLREGEHKKVASL